MTNRPGQEGQEQAWTYRDEGQYKGVYIIDPQGVKHSIGDSAAFREIAKRLNALEAELSEARRDLEDVQGQRDDNHHALDEARRQLEGVERWKDAALEGLPDSLRQHIEDWLRGNAKKYHEVKFGQFPLGMVQRWIERAEQAERQLDEALRREGELRALVDWIRENIGFNAQWLKNELEIRLAALTATKKEGAM